MDDKTLIDQQNEGQETRKRRMLNISEKIKLIKLMQNSPKRKKEIAAEFRIPINTVGSIYANREKYLEKCKGDFTNMNLKRLRPSTYPDIEEGLLNWYIKNHTNGHISCLTLRTKALQVARELGHDNFSASNGWIERFKSRHNLKFKRYKDKNLSNSAASSSNNDTLPDASQSGNSSETESFTQITPEESQLWEDTSNRYAGRTVIKQEFDDRHTSHCESLSSNQNGTYNNREGSPSPTHLIPEVHLTVTNADNQIRFQDDSQTLDYEIGRYKVSLKNVENAYSVILNYVENCDTKVSEKTLDALKELKTFISNEGERKSQSKITDYFNLL